MTTPRATTAGIGICGACAALLLGACATGPAHPAMMGGASGYQDSSLTCTAPQSPPGRTVRVRLGDMGMTRMMGGDAPLGAPMLLQAAPTVVDSGPVTVVASNFGWRTHEVVILPLTAQQQVGQRPVGSDGKVEESASLGEASATCAADEGDGIDSGGVGWTTVNLSPGRYELVCNLTNHYANGMYAEVDVR